MSNMKRMFEASIERLSEISGYSFGFLVDRYNEMIEDGEYDWEHFVGITMERDW